MICRIVLTRKRTPEKKEHVLYPLYLVCSGSLTVCCNPVLTLDRLSYNTLFFFFFFLSNCLLASRKYMFFQPSEK